MLRIHAVHDHQVPHRVHDYTLTLCAFAREDFAWKLLEVEQIADADPPQVTVSRPGAYARV